MPSTKLVLFFIYASSASAVRIYAEPPIPTPEAQSANVHLLSHRSCSNDETAPCNLELFKQLVHLSEKAANIPQISHHHLFQGLPGELMQDPRWAPHIGHFVRGRGFWFWKSALFNFLVRNGTIQDGDAVIWADPDDVRLMAYFDQPQYWPDQLACFTGQNLDLYVKSQWHELCESHCAKRDLCESHWTKGDIFERFNTTWDDPQYGHTEQADAQFFILNVNERTRSFMKLWEELMADFHLCSDERSIAGNSPKFRENRHDQSLLSMLVKAQVPSGDVHAKGCGGMLPETEWTRHPEFGILNFSAHIGDFLSLARDGNCNTLTQGNTDTKPFRRQIGPVYRAVCVLGDCKHM